MKVDGGCHCGRITYEAEIDPAKVLICHCTDCQSLSGGAFRTVVRVPTSAFKLLRGAPKVYVKRGRQRQQARPGILRRCGSPIYGAHPVNDPTFYGIRVGTLRQRDALAPKLQIWCRSAQPWSESLDAVPKVEQHA